MAFYNGAGGAGDATTDSTSQAIAATEAAAQAASSASAAANSATEAASSATSAASSASNASVAADTASTQASNAATSAATAGSYVTQVTEQATLADASAVEAATSASSALGYSDLAEDWAIKTTGAVAGGEYSAKYHATAAASSASDASTSASNAATSASDAEDSATAAALSETNAAASFDSFDDRYLGAKSSAPSVDNDGDAILTGALYWNTVEGKMYVYDGSWTAVTTGGAGSGTVTSVAMSVPTGLSVAGSPITSSGTLAVTYSSGYAIPTTAKQTEWDTAYGWGNHASAGYLTTSTAATTYQPLDGDLTAIAALSGTAGLVKKTAANTYTLDTSTYLTSYTETDPVFSASEAASITSTDTTNWDTAYGWGNHASAGYLTTSSAASTYQPLDSDLTTIAGLTPTNGYVIQGNGTAWTAVEASSGSGDVVGAASSTDNAIARYDGTTGKLIQNSAVTIDDTTGSMTFGSGTVDFKTSASNAQFQLNIAPSGTATTGQTTIFNRPDTANAGYINIGTSNTSCFLYGSKTGTGTSLPINISTDGTLALTIRTDKGVEFKGAIDETVYAVSGTTPALSPSNGTIQTWTLSANSTPTAGTWNDGESLTLMVLDGTAYTITWTSVSVTWVGGSAPTLDTTKQNVIELWKVGGTIYGAFVGAA